MAEVLRRHRGPVLVFARRLVGDSERAEDIAQEVFLRLWQRPDRFDVQRGSLRAFLIAITHGRSLDLMRSDTARRAREKRDGAGPNSSVKGVESQVVERTVASTVRDALAQLPDTERRAIELAYFGGHSYRMVAEILDVAEGTIKSRIRSGLGSLRTALAAQALQDP